MVVDASIPIPGVVFTHNNSVPNLIRGLGERLFKVPVGDGFAAPPRPVVFDVGTYADKVVKKMPRFESPITADAFVALYSGPKRKRYQSAADRIMQNAGVGANWADIQVFIKDEKVQSWSKSDPAPRLISPRSPEYCLELGRYIKPIEHLLYKAVARVWGDVTICKGLNFNERGQLLRSKWESFRDPVAIGADASRFDQHVSELALQWEHSIYRRCYVGKHKYLAYLLRQQLVNKGISYLDGKSIKYSVKGCRMSGDMNTALGNCLIMTAIVWYFLQSKQIKGKLANDGDDCVIFIERADLAEFQSGFAEFCLERGFTMKLEDPVDEFEQLEFCQCHPVWNGEQWTMARNVTKALFTDACHVGRSVEELSAIRYAIGDSGLSWGRGIPIFPSYYRFVQKSGRRNEKMMQKRDLMKGSGTYWNARGCNSGTSDITDGARLSFYRAFGITPAEQVTIENYYDSLVPGVLEFSNSPVLPYSPHSPCCEYPLFIDSALNTVVFNR